MNVISIVVPIYNEEKTLAQLLTALIEVSINGFTYKEIILVDDASIDGTPAIATSFCNMNYADCKMVCKRHGVNKGKGAALQTGIELSTGDVVLIQDADLE